MKNNILQSLTDEEILFRIQSDHNPDYYEILYSRYQRKVLDKCYGLVKNRQQAIELTEDIFSKAYEKLSTFKYLSSFSSWLYSVTYNHCIDYLRSRKKLHYPEWNRQHEIPEIIDETEENFEVISYENLLIILEMIHPEERALLYMKYQDNLSLKQISESLRISENAAKMRLKRARTRVIYLYKQKYSDKNNR